MMYNYPSFFQVFIMEHFVLNLERIERKREREKLA